MIQSTMKRDDEAYGNFPKLMIDDEGWVLMMTTDREGVVVYIPSLDNRGNSVGMYSPEWDQPMTDFHGTITMGNKE